MRTILFMIFAIYHISSVASVESTSTYATSSNTTVLTPGGQPVTVLIIQDDFTEVEKAQLATDVTTSHPGATILAPATKKYNCHNYAWHMTEGFPTEKYWMDPANGNAPNISKYWTNDHFVETTGNVYDKIIYYEVFNPYHDAFISHSAVTSSVSGYYESKWGNLPLVRHLPDDVPPIYGTIKRYFKPVPPTVVYAPLVCEYNQATINRNTAANYSSTSLGQSFVYDEIEIFDNKGNNAIDNGKAIVNNIYNCGANITFTRLGTYDITLRLYNKYHELLGEYTYQQIVV